ncbi:P-type conjugative transfer protein TrbG [Paracoccus pantotrophus]|uniref:P-type conjugative transfer protein TrbG n=1 Tax=Paracoccus pantotrophus TaxID=82367 RepID=UPI000466A957|nr:P-type conjugative transfer protein TrbG [Paracoccus pantotrophus]RDD97807.1 P-type conjugative transfer protein TrbG [Paracoccus pantotrophus]WGR66200.1 P-type conjugative transfer protein TrbG [Paracoccus pantotrophus]
MIRSPALPALAFAAAALAGCASSTTPQFSYDDDVPPLPSPPATAPVDPTLIPLHVPPGWTPTRGGGAAETPEGRVTNANAAARVEPRREGYYNAIQVYPWSEGALYQVYAAPGQITDIALEHGETLSGEGSIAAGDTARWIIGDTESGSGNSRRVHVFVKPTREDISTNLVITTDRRVYMIELRAREALYMPSVAWTYPAQPAGKRQPSVAAPVIPAPATRNYRYGLQIEGASPPWRPVSVFDDGRRVFVVFPRGIAQGEMPPLFVIGPDGAPEIVNSRVYGNVMIVDRLFGVAELRLGSGKRQQVVRIIRMEQTRAVAQPTRAPTKGSS